VFNFIHVNGAHVDIDYNVRSTMGYHYVEETDTLAPRGNYVESTYGCFKLIDSYLDHLREIGVYDNTTIILLADHGRSWKMNLDEENPAITSILFIKPKNSSGEFAVDAVSEMSNKYLAPTILEVAGLPHDSLGLSYFDIIGMEDSPVREFYTFSSWWNAYETSQTIETTGFWRICDDANDFSNWTHIEP